MTGTSAWIAADGDFRPSRPWSAMNGSTMPSRQPRISPSRMPSQAERHGRLDDLGEAGADVVQVARVEPDVRAALVELGADAVVLVLDPDLRPEPGDDLGGVLGRRGEHELERVEQGQGRVAERVVAGEAGQPADVADEHARPLDVVERAVEGLGDGRLHEPLAQADPQVAAEHLDDVLGRQRVGPLEQRRAGWPTCAPARRPSSISANAAATSGSVGLVSGGGCVAGRRSGPRRRRCPGRTTGRTPRRGRTAGPCRGRSRSRRWPTSRGRPRAGRPPRRGGRSGRRPRSAARRASRPSQVVGQEGRLLGGPGGRREALGELAPATHAGDGIPSPGWCSEPWFPEALIGVAGRPAPARAGEHRRLPALVRGPRDRPAGALPGRRPMRPEEIERFFAARVVGTDALAMAVHEKATDRLVGTCAFSQLDGDNGSALYHITIGEADAWGRGLRHRGDPADARPRVRDARACIGSRCSCSSSTSAPSAPTALRVRGRGPVARVDLARRSLVGRAGDERPRVGLARRAATRRAGDETPRADARPTPRHEPAARSEVGRRRAPSGRRPDVLRGRSGGST